MSKGKWTPLACPNGHREEAELAARMEDIVARLHTAQADLGVLSMLVRQVELRAKRDRRTAA